MVFHFAKKRFLIKKKTDKKGGRKEKEERDNGKRERGVLTTVRRKKKERRRKTIYDIFLFVGFCAGGESFAGFWAKKGDFLFLNFPQMGVFVMKKCF